MEAKQFSFESTALRPHPPAASRSAKVSVRANANRVSKRGGAKKRGKAPVEGGVLPTISQSAPVSNTALSPRPVNRIRLQGPQGVKSSHIGRRSHNKERVEMKGRCWFNRRGDGDKRVDEEKCNTQQGLSFSFLLYLPWYL